MVNKTSKSKPNPQKQPLTYPEVRKSLISVNQKELK